MKYRVIAKAFLFVNGSRRDIEESDAPWLTEGEKKKFTQKQLDKLNSMFADLVEKQADKLEQQGADLSEMLKRFPKPPQADVTTNLDPSN